MNTLPETILIHARSLPEGGLVSPKAFLHLGTRAAVDQALSRLSKEGKLLRVARGAWRVCRAHLQPLRYTRACAGENSGSAGSPKR